MTIYSIYMRSKSNLQITKTIELVDINYKYERNPKLSGINGSQLILNVFHVSRINFRFFWFNISELKLRLKKKHIVGIISNK